MRIATNTIFSAGLASMQDQQSTLADLTNQISSGKSVSTPGDNGVAAARAVQLQSTSTALTQYSTTRQAATSALQQEDSTLGSVTTVLQQVQQLALQAGDASLSNDDRAAIATQIRADRSQLMGLANSTDATGNYVFGGFRSGSPPFANAATGTGATYLGDAGQRQMQIGATRQISVGDSGIDVFTRALPGSSANIASAGVGNTGTATFSQLSVVQPGAADLADSFQVKFSVVPGTPPQTTYTVQNTTAQPALPASAPQTYTAGAAIALGNGQALTIDGTPANNDSFGVAPASNANANIFKTMDDLAATLSTPLTDTASRTALTNSLGTYSAQLSNTYNNVLTVRASVGAREQEVSALDTQAKTVANNTTTELSGLTSVDVVAAYSQFSQLQTTLQAAQKAFVSVRSLSLFSMINP